jgi:hypothetical protein
MMSLVDEEDPAQSDPAQRDPSIGGDATRVVFVVARSEERLYTYLKDSFSDVDTVQVLLDRRVSERRRVQAPPEEDRRRGSDRRGHDVSRSLAELGWAVVRRDGIGPSKRSAARREGAAALSGPRR